MSNFVGSRWALLKGRSKFLRKAVKAAFVERLRCECSLCGYEGSFFPSGTPSVPNAGCPGCGSGPRHRLLALVQDRHRLLDFPSGTGAVLHFAAEPCLRPMIQSSQPKTYTRADIDPRRGDLVIDIEKIDLPSESYDAILCSHVLEHVDDGRALPELFRILRPKGKLIAMVPLIEGWDQTYENPKVEDWHERKIHFGGGTHVRCYGKDFRRRLERAGFVLSEFTGSPAQTIRHGLIAGERVFVGTKA